MALSRTKFSRNGCASVFHYIFSKKNLHRRGNPHRDTRAANKFFSSVKMTVFVVLLTYFVIRGLMMNDYKMKDVFNLCEMNSKSRVKVVQSLFLPYRLKETIKIPEHVTSGTSYI